MNGRKPKAEGGKTPGREPGAAVPRPQGFQGGPDERPKGPRVESAELRVLRIPLVQPFRTSFGVEEERATLVTVVRGGGLAGYGESPVSAFPGYSYETVETGLHVLCDFILPSLPGFELSGPPLVLPDQFGRVRGHNIAKSGVEAAMWDLLAKARGIPVSRALGGVRGEIEVGVSIGIQPSVPKLLERIRFFLERGYSRIKVKIEHGWDADVLRSVRGEFGDLRLWADANQDYGPGDIDRIAGFDAFGLELIEQPFTAGDLVSHASLASRMRTPVCLDESVENLGQFRAAAAMKALGVLNIKAPRVGGLGAAIGIHDDAAAAGMPVWAGGLLETGIGRLHNIALASLANFRLPGDISESARYFAKDVINPPVTLSRPGFIAVPSGPGIGAEVDMEALDGYTLRTAEFH